MRKFVSVLILLLTASAFAQTPVSGPAVETKNSEKARALLDQMIQALGGQAYLNIQDREQEGRAYSFYNGQPNSLGTPFWIFQKFPDKERVELTKQRDVVYIYNGDKGYEVTYKGTAAMEPKSLREALRLRNHSLEYVLRVWLPDPKTALFYNGTAVAEQKACDSVTLLNAENDSVTIYIDRYKHLPVKTTFSWRDPLDRLKDDEEVIYDNYRTEQGIQTPHTILRKKNGDTTSQRFITKVTYNKGLPDSMFEATVNYDPYAPPKK